MKIAEQKAVATATLTMGALAVAGAAAYMGRPARSRR